MARTTQDLTAAITEFLQREHPKAKVDKIGKHLFISLDRKNIHSGTKLLTKSEVAALISLPKAGV
jgi:hypothetical protein